MLFIQLQRACVDQLRHYREVDDDHDGTSKTMGEYIDRWRLAHIQDAFFQEFNATKVSHRGYELDEQLGSTRQPNEQCSSDSKNLFCFQSLLT